MTGPAQPTLAPERTALAWRRTALGLVAGSVAAGRLLSVVWGVAAWGVAAAGTVLAVVVLVAARRRRTGGGRGLATVPHTTASDAVERAPGGRLVTACAAALVLLGLAALAVVLTGAV